MQTELGMQMMAEAESIAQNAAWCRELGLRFVELHMSLPACQPEALDKRELRGLMDRNGIYFTLHLPEDMDPAHVSAPVREA
jgi:sugar phosphate isomerase/epimerase